MSIAELKAGFKIIEEHIRSSANSVFVSLDRLTFRMLIDTLKSTDPQAVKEAIDQLVKEKRPIAIPPLYLVCHAHASPWVQEQAKLGLQKLISQENLSEAELDKMTNGKNISDAIQALITKFGNYRDK